VVSYWQRVEDLIGSRFEPHTSRTRGRRLTHRENSKAKIWLFNSQDQQSSKSWFNLHIYIIYISKFGLISSLLLDDHLSNLVIIAAV